MKGRYHGKWSVFRLFLTFYRLSNGLKKFWSNNQKDIYRKEGILSVCAPPPQYVTDPQLQSTYHYIVNHYVKIWHVSLGGGGAPFYICTHLAFGKYPKRTTENRPLLMHCRLHAWCCSAQITHITLRLYDYSIWWGWRGVSIYVCAQVFT